MFRVGPGLTAGGGANDVILVRQLAFRIVGVVYGRPPSGLPIGEGLAVNLYRQELDAAMQRSAAFRALDHVRVVAWIGHRSFSLKLISSNSPRPSSVTFT